METSFETLIASYIENKVGISEGFLSDELCENLKSNLLALNSDQQMQTAGIGNDAKMVHNDLIRNDKIYWLDKGNNNVFICRSYFLFSLFEAMMMMLVK